MTSMARPMSCPKCGSTSVRRHQRSTGILAMPYLCQTCQHEWEPPLSRRGYVSAMVFAVAMAVASIAAWLALDMAGEPRVVLNIPNGYMVIVLLLASCAVFAFAYFGLARLRTTAGAGQADVRS